MHRCPGGSILALAIAAPLAVLSAAPAAGGPPVDADWRLCGAETARLERLHGLHDRLLAAISLVEAGRREAGTGRVRPWPWTIMAQGRSRYLRTKADAIREVRRLQRRGVKNIDVGCMQVNLRWHAGASRHLAEAFDPETNVAYAARFLNRLYRQERSWRRAVARYPSRTPGLHESYGRRVRAAWRQARRLGSEAPPAEKAGAKPRPPAPATGRQVRPSVSPESPVILWQNRRHLVLKPAAARADTRPR